MLIAGQEEAVTGMLALLVDIGGRYLNLFGGTLN